VADQTRTIIDDPEQHRLGPGASAGENAAAAMMEIEMPEGTDMVDLETAHFQAFEPVAGQQRALARAFRAGLAEQASRLEVTAHGGIGRQGRIAGEGGAQVVVMQLHGPAGMLAVLGLQAGDGGGREAGELPDVGTPPVLQGRHRVACGAGGVVPALEGRGSEADIQAGGRVAPGFSGEAGQGGAQFARVGWGGQQGADNREAQARPTIAFEGIDNRGQGSLPKLRRRRRRLWEGRLRSLGEVGYPHPLRVISGPRSMRPAGP